MAPHLVAFYRRQISCAELVAFHFSLVASPSPGVRADAHIPIPLPARKQRTSAMLLRLCCGLPTGWPKGKGDPDEVLGLFYSRGGGLLVELSPDDDCGRTGNGHHVWSSSGHACPAADKPRRQQSGGSEGLKEWTSRAGNVQEPWR